MKTALLFPGQGSQSFEMLDAFMAAPEVKDCFTEASDVLGQDFAAMLKNHDAAINETVNTQPLMLLAGVAVYRHCQKIGIPKPDFVAGHSLGEYTALVVAESLSFADALQLVKLRAQAMQEAVAQGVGAMAAILGLDDDKIIDVCRTAAGEQVVEAVNFNAPGQVVIAGHATAVAHAIDLAKEAGARRALMLPVSVPSHCRLMQPAATQLQAALQNVVLTSPCIQVIHNVDARSHDDAAAIKDALVRQLYSPVRWTDSIRYLVTQGVTHFAECAPGKVLSGLNKRIDKSVPCAALTDPDACAAFVASLSSHL